MFESEPLIQQGSSIFALVGTKCENSSNRNVWRCKQCKTAEKEGEKLVLLQPNNLCTGFVCLAQGSYPLRIPFRQTTTVMTWIECWRSFNNSELLRRYKDSGAVTKGRSNSRQYKRKNWRGTALPWRFRKTGADTEIGWVLEQKMFPCPLFLLDLFSVDEAFKLQLNLFFWMVASLPQIPNFIQSTPLWQTHIFAVDS